MGAIKINGSTSGSTTITAPATGSDETIELSSVLLGKVSYATPVNAQTGTTYTFVADDANRITTSSNASAVTFTIPPESSVSWAANTMLRVVNYGAGLVTVDGGSGVTVTNTATTINQYFSGAAIRTGSDAWTVVPFGGGDIPAAEVSSPAATGQYTDTGITYDYYTFTSSGTLTVDTAGFADVLVVGGGGGGGRDRGGGGGAGGHLYATDVYLASGTATVRVGAGGTGGNLPEAQRPSGVSGNASGIGDYIVAPGGGGGGGSGQPGGNGGSGGGGGETTQPGGSAFTPQGKDGGAGSSSNTGGGGGGADTAGATAGASGGNGGAGLANSITGSAVTRAGGGGGGSRGGTAGTGGIGGGGNGTNTNTTGGTGTANTGGGGGAGGQQSSGSFLTGAGGAGGSGVVIVRVKV